MLVMINMKTCTRCGVEKELDCFYARKAMRDGRQSWCKQCVIERQSERYRASIADLPRVAFDRRTCSRCRVEKERSRFSRNQWTCKMCHVEIQREYRAADPDFSTRANLRQKYKMTLERYQEMLEAQGGGCAICGAEPKKARLHVDHDHRCCPGKRTCGRCVRGLVCYPCNTKLSVLESNSDYARRVREYLGVEVHYIE